MKQYINSSDRYTARLQFMWAIYDNLIITNSNCPNRRVLVLFTELLSQIKFLPNGREPQKHWLVVARLPLFCWPTLCWWTRTGSRTCLWHTTTMNEKHLTWWKIFSSSILCTFKIVSHWRHHNVIWQFFPSHRMANDVTHSVLTRIEVHMDLCSLCHQYRKHGILGNLCSYNKDIGSGSSH